MVQRLVVAAAAAAVVSPAFAQMTLLTDNRSITASSFAQNTVATDTDGPYSAMPGGFGATFNTNVSAVASVFGAGAPCGASAFSEMLPGSYTLQGNVSGIANVNETNGGVAASIFASSELFISFSVGAGTQMTLQGSSSGLAGFTISDGNGILIQDLGIMNLTTTQPTTFTVSALAQVNLMAPPTAGDSGAFSILISAVPAPGACGLLALAGVCASRRRRR
jgi:hypothetical protein